MQQRTLGDLRKDLADRLGMSSQVPTPDTVRVLNSFLREAHDFLMLHYVWPELRRDWVFNLVVGQTLYSLPADDCGYTPDDIRFVSVHVKVGSIWQLPMACGITPEHYIDSLNGIPCRYDISHGDGGAA